VHSKITLLAHFAKDFSLSLLAARQVCARWSNIFLDSILSQQFVDIRKKGLFGLLLWGPHTLLTPAALTGTG